MMNDTDTIELVKFIECKFSTDISDSSYLLIEIENEQFVISAVWADDAKRINTYLKPLGMDDLQARDIMTERYKTWTTPILEDLMELTDTLIMMICGHEDMDYH